MTKDELGGLWRWLRKYGELPEVSGLVNEKQLAKLFKPHGWETPAQRVARHKRVDAELLAEILTRMRIQKTTWVQFEPFTNPAKVFRSLDRLVAAGKLTVKKVKCKDSGRIFPTYFQKERP